MGSATKKELEKKCKQPLIPSLDITEESLTLFSLHLPFRFIVEVPPEPAV